MKKVVKISVFVSVAILLLIALFLNKNADISEQKNVEALALEPKYSIVNELPSYYGDTRGYLAKPSSPGVYPGIIMIHEWWGLNENIRETANQLASQGYIVLAVDLYNGEVALNSTRAGELSSGVRKNSQKAIENMQAAISYLKEKQKASKIASLGWCFGGGQSLQISLNSKDVDATIIYYGNLVTNKTQLSGIENPVLGIFGSEDTSIPVSSVMEFDKLLDELGINNEIYIYEGVGHAFANPSGMNYAPNETEDAWIKTLNFLDKNLKSS
ncbi:MAG TPA: dienelactone hydrolase family protein [Candidatus Nanoarchaeia archaeon]|nr:dienelactone hydrolase family protein [Candidatus Nanoarchaeia archaeon]